MEEENKISFWKKIKISIFGLEYYQTLATQKLGKTVGYLVKLMLIFVFILSLVLTYNFSTTVQNVKQYIENEIAEINYEDNTLTIIPNEQTAEAIIVEDDELWNGKVIINTGDLTSEEIDNYTEDIKSYTNGILILKDKIIIKTEAATATITVLLTDISEQYNIVKLDKQNILDMLSGSNAWVLYATFFATMYVYMFIIYFSSVLVDAILYSLLGYITGVLAKLRLKFSATYNIAVYALTLPIILNLAYIVINFITGYTIKYFDIMYMAITCIYIITAILMIKSDLIKRQIELSRIISEQEKVKQEMERKAQEKKEEEERERIRKEDERKKQEEKEQKEGKTNEKKEQKKSDGSNSPQPEANIKPSNL